MSYRLTETERKYVSVIEDLILKIIKDPNEPSQLLLTNSDGDKLDLTVKLPKYKLSYDHDTNSLRLIEEVYNSLDISETVEWGWKYTIEGLYDDEYLTGIKIIRLNDGWEDTLDLTKLKGGTFQSITVNEISEFLNSVFIKGVLQVEGDSYFEGNVTIDQLLKVLQLEVTNGARIKNLQIYDDDRWIDVGIAENGKLGLVEGIEEEGIETFGEISIKKGKCKVNNIFFEFSEEFDNSKEGLHFIIEEDTYRE
jgi:hypothetical protein